MNWSGWVSRWLPIAAFGVTLFALLDPIEGFAVVLIGGVLALMASLQSGESSRLITSGVGLAAVGSMAMVWLSSVGGVGAASGRSPWWLLIVAPYPIGILMFLIGIVVILRERWRKSP